METLIKFNFKMGLAHFIQGSIMVLLALFVLTDLQDFQPNIVAYYMSLDENFELITTSKVLFQIPFALVTTGFVFISAFFHFLIVLFKKTYKRQIESGYNRFRWYEYALSSSLLIVLLAILFGVRDIQTLSIIFIANAVMNLLGLEMELQHQFLNKKRFNAYNLGWIIGLAPWLVIMMYLLFSPGLDLIPWYAWASIITYFAFFNSFALNMFLQYKQVGPWKNYIFGEKVYVWLSLIAKSTIAWIVFSGAIQTSDIINQLF
jgi:hypothetical protein